MTAHVCCCNAKFIMKLLLNGLFLEFLANFIRLLVLVSDLNFILIEIIYTLYLCFIIYLAICLGDVEHFQASFTYADAQAIIDDSKRNDDIAQSLRSLNNLAKKLKAKRIENGALTLSSPEIRFEVDSETHDPIQVQEKQLRYTHKLNNTKSIDLIIH